MYWNDSLFQYLQIILGNNIPLDSIQLIISTNGKISFAAFVYFNPAVVLSNIWDIAIGFDGGRKLGYSSADFGEFLLRKGALDEVNIFRIDGRHYNH